MIIRKLNVKDGCYLWVMVKGSLGEMVGKFHNLDLLKVKMYQLGYKNPQRYDIVSTLRVDDAYYIINFDDFQRLNTGEYCAYSPEIGDFIKFIETYSEQVNKLGYLIFDNGDSVKSDRSVSPKYAKILMKQIREGIANYMEENPDVISSFSINDRKHVKIKLFGSSQQIYICYNSQLMSLNQERKINGWRCLPYDTRMDKYTTFYVYTTNQFYPDYNEDKDYANNILQDIIKYISDIKEVRFSEVDFMGHIYL